MAVKIPKEDFLGYDAKFASCGGKDWLLLGLIGSVLFGKVFKEHYREVFALKTQVSEYKLTMT